VDDKVGKVDYWLDDQENVVRLPKKSKISSGRQNDEAVILSHRVFYLVAV
jgi:hypothetical protein